ncbi:MAG: CBS domain-containing protein [Acidobacteria bacterium]|nr:CBS domain-containing protein [Acidobacteriota bacterium]MBU4307453.1 CBS domain-containing protein [Acidobacteriota bacterium]MBU4405122.1 CBS domain-containing protein [Acidobacteriota bacterium]MCG2812122.1 CBS domain-containing protein [Candidatus Aminicenantes bacterium]
MKVERILESKGGAVFSVHVDAIVSDALQSMDEKNIGALMVIDSQENIQGIVSERDIMRNCFRNQANVKGLAIRDVMTPRAKLLVARAEDDVNDLMGAMTQNHIRHIPVVNEQDKVVGMVSIGDIIKAMLKDKDYQIRHLKDYIESKYPL